MAAGTFQIKWTFIKDIPNNQFRHIILESVVAPADRWQELHVRRALRHLRVVRRRAGLRVMRHSSLRSSLRPTV